eukprot:m51a1_g6992 hypothetical protein (416) ;mRNA; r:171732-172979
MTQATACRAKFEASFERNLAASKRAAAAAERRNKCVAAAREAAQATQAQRDRVAEAQRALVEAQQRLDAESAHLKRSVEAETAAVEQQQRAESEASAASQEAERTAECHKHCEAQLEEVGKREAELGERISSMKLGALTCGDVVDVLKEVGLRELCGLFERNNVDGAVLEIVDTKQLQSCLGVEGAGDRARILHVCQTIKTFGRLTLSDAALETTVAARLPEEVRDAVMAPSWTEEQVAAWMRAQGFSEAIGQQARSAGLTGERLLFDADAVMALDVPGGDKIKLQRKTGELHKAHMDALTHFFTRLRAPADAPADGTPGGAQQAAAAAPPLEGAAAALEQRVPPMFKCPITLGLMRDPVVAPDGFFYERAAIEKWLLARGTSPMTRKPMSVGSLMALVSLRNEIAEWLRGNRPA